MFDIVSPFWVTFLQLNPNINHHAFIQVLSVKQCCSRVDDKTISCTLPSWYGIYHVQFGSFRKLCANVYREIFEIRYFSVPCPRLTFFVNMLKESNSATKVTVKTQTHGDVYQAMYVVLTDTVFVNTVKVTLFSDCIFYIWLPKSVNRAQQTLK